MTPDTPSKMDANEFFRTHTREDFLALPRISYWDMELGLINSETPEEFVKTSREMFISIAAQPEITHDEYLKKIKGRTGYSMENLRKELKRVIAEQSREGQSRRGSLKIASTEPTETLVSEALAALNVSVPDEIRDLNLVMPSGFMFDQGGTAMLTPGRDGMRRDEVAPGWILPIGRYKNVINEEEHIRLAFYERRAWHAVTVERAAAVDAKRLTPTIAAYGVPVGSPNSRIVAQYVLSFLTCNAERMPLDRTKNQNGWSV